MEKYLVASSGDTLDAKVSGRFGHAVYFIVVDPLTMEFKAFPGIQADESGLNIKQFITRDIKRVIVGNIGPSSFDEMVSSGYTLYLCRNMTVYQAVEKVRNGDVEPLKYPTLKDSIHSARKAFDGYDARAGGAGMGIGLRSGRRMGNGRGGGLGRRTSIGDGRGMGGGKGRGK
jgi:predicted Fe-Mo cluster-binding NifX family protein